MRLGLVSLQIQSRPEIQTIMHKPFQQGTSGTNSSDRESGQHQPLQKAFAELQTYKLTVNQVQRVAVERRGAIHIEIHAAGKQRFFVYEANELLELAPENDPKIPLAAELKADQFAAEHMIISYRPGRRIVLGPAGGEHGRIIKGYRKRRAKQAEDRYSLVQNACENTGFDVPELLQYKADMDCLVMAKQPGHTPRITGDATAEWMRIGSCLQRFQQSVPAVALPEFSYRDELDVLDERARRFALCMPNLPEKWQIVRERLEGLAENLPNAVNGLTHRDLHDRQFIVSGKTISLLDFDLVCIADVALDAGNLLAHIKLRNLQQGTTAVKPEVDICSRAFLDGLNRQGERGFEHKLLFYQATTFYRLTLLYALRPRWSHLTEALINQGKRCIDAINKLERQA